MLANLLTTLIIACGVGVSSFEDHNPNIQKNELYSENIGLTNIDDAYSIIYQNTFIYFSESLDFTSSEIYRYLPSGYDVEFLGASEENKIDVEWFIEDTEVYMSSCKLWFEGDAVSHSYVLKTSTPLGTYDVYSYNSSSLDNYHFYDYFFHTYHININRSRIITDIFDGLSTCQLFTFYLSTYRFKGSIYNFYNSNFVHLFSTSLVNNFFGVSDIHGIKNIYKGWFKHNGVYYDTIRATCIDAQGVKYYNGRLVGSSTSLSSVPVTANTYIYLMNIEFYNSVIDYSYFAFLPVYYTYDNSINTYIDVSANGWRDNKNVEFLSISIDGKPQGRSDLNNLGYYDFVTHDNDLVASSNNGVSNYWLNSSFNLINSALVGLGGLFSIQILPFVNLGTLIFLPLLFVIVLAVVKLFKR